MHDGNVADQRFFLVGIGGSGMMPLAMILRGRGATVAGSDRGLDQGRVPAKFEALRALGIDLFAQDGSGVTAPEQIVVASAADAVPRRTVNGASRTRRSSNVRARRMRMCAI